MAIVAVAGARVGRCVGEAIKAATRAASVAARRANVSSVGNKIEMTANTPKATKPIVQHPQRLG
jgi:hypothetical protein